MTKTIIFFIFLIFYVACDSQKKSQETEHVSSNPFLQLETLDQTKKRNFSTDDLMVSMFQEDYRKDDLPFALKMKIYRIEQEAYEKIHTAIREYATRVLLSDDLESPKEFIDFVDKDKVEREAQEIFEQRKHLLGENSNEDLAYQSLKQNLLIEEYVRLFSETIKDIEERGNLNIRLYPPRVPRDFDFNLSELPSIGAQDSPYEIIMVSNYSCEACRQSQQQVSRLLRDFNDQIYFSFIPLSTKKDDLNYHAVSIGKCLFWEEPRHYWNYHVQLINQEGFSSMARSTNKQEIERFKDSIFNVLDSQDVDVAAIKKCLEGERLKNARQRLLAVVNTLGFKEMPKFIINGHAWNLTSSGIYKDFQENFQN